MEICSEAQEQMAFLEWFEWSYPKILILHIPNGERRDARTGAKLKRMGVKAGIPDLFIPEWRIWIEMKSNKGRLSPIQSNICERLTQIGYEVIVGYGFEDAKNKLKALLFSGGRASRLSL